MGALKKFLVGIFKVVYEIIAFFNLQYALLVLLIGLILFFTGVFKNSVTALVIFLIIFGLSVLLAVQLSLGKIFKGSKKPKKQNSIVDVSLPPENTAQKKETEEKKEGFFSEKRFDTAYSPYIAEEKPRYFRIKSNPKYVMAEFSDRYELYYEDNGQLKKIRTDYKR